jgi:hypothetical protein
VSVVFPVDSEADEFFGIFIPVVHIKSRLDRSAAALERCTHTHTHTLVR